MNMESGRSLGKLASGAGQFKNNSALSRLLRLEDYELAHEFLELVKYYSPSTAIDSLAVKRLGYDPEEYQILQSDGHPWNGWLVHRETGFTEFVTGLYMRYAEERKYIASRILSVFSAFSDELTDIAFDARCQLDSIEREWERVMNIKVVK